MLGEKESEDAAPFLEALPCSPPDLARNLSLKKGRASFASSAGRVGYSVLGRGTRHRLAAPQRVFRSSRAWLIIRKSLAGGPGPPFLIFGVPHARFVSVGLLLGKGESSDRQLCSSWQASRRIRQRRVHRPPHHLRYFRSDFAHVMFFRDVAHRLHQHVIQSWRACYESAIGDHITAAE